MDFNHSDISQLHRRTLDEANAQVRAATRSAPHFSLRELINSQMEHPLWVVDKRAVDAAYELSESSRQSSGTPPNGIWIPFSSLTRDLTSTGNTALTTGVIGNKLQSALAVESAVMGGATILSGLEGSTFSVPVLGTAIDTTSTWVTEGANGNQREPATKVATLTPKSMIFQIIVSRRLLANASVDMEADLRAHILQRAMLEIDRAALGGIGGAEPSGLLSDAGLQVLSAGTNGAAPTWAHLVEAEYQVGTRVGQMQSPTFLSSPALRKKMRTTQRAAGLDFIVSENVNAVMGQPLRTSALVPDNLTKGTSVGNCSALVFGDLAEIIVGFWGPLAVDLLVDSRTLAAQAKVKITCRVEVGVSVRNVGAFAAYKDLLSA
jgi:HK97 family phage major capsid protein